MSETSETQAKSPLGSHGPFKRWLSDTRVFILAMEFVCLIVPALILVVLTQYGAALFTFGLTAVLLVCRRRFMSR
jgi:hypothetical protein